MESLWYYFQTALRDGWSWIRFKIGDSPLVLAGVAVVVLILWYLLTPRVRND